MQTRSTIARLINSKATFVGLSTTAVLAVAGTTFGYSAMSHDVTVSLDGQQREVSAMGGTVGDVLEAEGIEVDDRDVVAPSLDEEVTDGSAISVRFARPLELKVDGETSTHWVTATDVAGALSQVGSRFAGADLSVSRGGSIDREGMTLEVVTEKTVDVKVADQKVVTRKIPAMSSREVLKEMGVKLDKHDEITPGHQKELEDGDRVVFTDIDVKTKRVKAEAIDFSTIEREDSSMLEGNSDTVRSGRAGVRDVTYRQTFRNGELVTTKVLEAGGAPQAGRRDRRGRHQGAGARAGRHVQLRLRQHRVGPARRVRVRRQLGDQHRQRLLRRAAVQPGDLAVLRRPGLPARGQPRDPDRDRREGPCRHRWLRLLAGLLRGAGPAPVIEAVTRLARD